MQNRMIRNLGALALGAMLALSGAAQAETGHKHDHAAHKHDSKSKVYKGYFEDAQVKDRPISDWAGDWQSVYPLLVSGQLDSVMAHKAESGDKTAAEYRTYYETGYKTDVDRITFEGNKATFHRGAAAVSGEYAADGHEILTYAKGNRGVRFIFRKVSGDAGAPGFIQFSDHKIAPEKSDHYHLYWGDDRARLLDEMTNWPTYYPAALSADDIVEEMLAH